jgi:hypothetical protein
MAAHLFPFHCGRHGNHSPETAPGRYSLWQIAEKDILCDPCRLARQVKQFEG